MALGVRLLWIFVIVSASFVCKVLLAKNYNIVLTEIKCNHNSKYASSSSCTLIGPLPALGANFNMQIKKEINTFRMDLSIYLSRMKKYFLLYNALDFDVCKEFLKNHTAIYFELFKEMTQRAGEWPKCPVSKDYFFKYDNITPSSDYLPPYLPQVVFKLVIIMKDKKEQIMDTTVLGKIVHTKVLKSNKRS